MKLPAPWGDCGMYSLGADNHVSVCCRRRKSFGEDARRQGSACDRLQTVDDSFDS